jgi:uncharacterized protein YjbI with pentapeptide repeats
MEILKHQKLNEDIDSHRKALKGDSGFERLEMGVFYQKELSDFLLEDIEDLGSYPIHNSFFKNCIFSNVDFGRAEFYQTTLERCIFEKCSFIKSDIQQVKLINCVFLETNFFGCSLDGVIEGSIFRNCKLDKMHLSESDIRETIFTGETDPPSLRENKEENVLWNLTKTSL